MELRASSSATVCARSCSSQGGPPGALGERIGEYRVLSIDRDRGVTLEADGGGRLDLPCPSETTS